jgi:hypothetical protein
VPVSGFQTQDYKIVEEDVAFLDNHLLILHKPAGLLVQADKEGSPSLEEAAKENSDRLGRQRETIASARRADVGNRSGSTVDLRGHQPNVSKNAERTYVEDRCT